MLVYVINKDGRPLMPCKPQRARKLLKNKKAKIINYEPFTIQLLYGSAGHTQPVTLGVDTGSKIIGLSAVANNKEIYASETELRNDIVKLLSGRRESRRSRRSRKTRYRKPRFDNRTRPDKWLAPSIRHKIDTHLSVIEQVYRILPVSKLIVEPASFDIQKIKDPDISGTEYQEGDQLGFWNIREFVLWRDGHVCQCCKGKSGDKILTTHHIESRQTGGDAPNNLITLCKTCHTGYHQGTVTLPKRIKRGMSFRDAAFMGIMRWALYEELKAQYKNVSLTYGYVTKQKRIEAGLAKGHAVDARCITGFPEAEPLGYYFRQKKVRCHNRQIHKQKIMKGGKRKLNQAPHEVKGFRLYDKVELEGQVGFIFGRRSSGYFDIRTLDGTVLSRSAPYKKLKLVTIRKSMLTEVVKTG